METIIRNYNRQCDMLRQELQQLNRKIHQTGTLRLLTALAGVSLFFVEADRTLLLAAGGLCLVVFFALMMVHNRLFARRTYCEKRLQLNENELKGINYDYSAFDGAPERISGEHSYSHDLDLFGDRSLFQSLNRTVTAGGKAVLAQWTTEPCDRKEEILKRQEAVGELSGQEELFEHFYTTGKLQPSTSNNRNRLKRLVDEFKPVSGGHLFSVLMWAIPTGWIALGSCYAYDLVSSVWLSSYTLIALAISLYTMRMVDRVYNHSDKLNANLTTYASLIAVIEQQNHSSALLRDLQQRLMGEKGEPTSHLLHTLSKQIKALEQRFSLAGLLLNLFCLRDVRHAQALERWMQHHRNDILKWTDALSEYDALLSLGHYAYNHPDYHFPTVDEKYFCYRAKGLGHPLMNRERCVHNDIHVNNSAQFLIITGANMAGKSTYLRTVGTNFLLASIGLPVCAESMEFSPAHLVTSLRTTDSLNDNESYFFAELKRLKMIIDRLKEGEQLFIILDEILKGTNSADKQKGSLALVRQLLSYGASGIIATHDLVLGTLADELPGKVENFCFEADIHDDELTFSYQMRPGIAQNMNACFLMRKMHITV